MIKIIKRLWHNLFKRKESNDKYDWPKTFVFEDTSKYSASTKSSNPTLKIKVVPYKEKD